MKLVAADNPLGLDRSDPAAKDEITTINQLNLPVNRPAIIHLSSKDVIHSFFIPSLRFKQDMVPGHEIPAWFKATKPGKYEIPCAELCGFGHSGMRGWLYVQAQEEYDAWVREHRAGPTGGGRRSGS